ncbi:F-box domain-containing protein [Artemisia annua]|uniref:F-box domain-containing protein n=1 Tax=Artemisia annua TaxID=35608 RepID=A0A2U1KCL8_ARTAN|nr:F-box domain-containing protein [Artemisia annua]
MAKTRSMTREQKRLKTSEEGGSASWSDLFGDLLIIVMMRLGLVDFVSFSGVCKRWRSIAHSQWKTFMGCKVPMCMSFFNSRGFWLEDFAGRRFKTIRRHGTHRTCVGSTRGYLIMFGRVTSDFCLVNPITRHEFHFTDFPWRQITHHPANFRVKLEPEPTFVLIRIKNFTFLKIYRMEFVSSGKNLYLVGWITKSMYKVLEVNFDTMEWENPEKTIGQYAFYFNGMCTSAAATTIKPNTQARGVGRTQSKIICFRSADQSKKECGLRTIARSMWYFPQDCLNVKLASMGEMEN